MSSPNAKLIAELEQLLLDPPAEALEITEMAEAQRVLAGLPVDMLWEVLVSAARAQGWSITRPPPKTKRGAGGDPLSRSLLSR